MKKEMFCISCEHIFEGEEKEECPNCNSEHTEALPNDWDINEGHFEGSFPSSNNSHDDEDKPEYD